jgi:hypothetical protein
MNRLFQALKTVLKLLRPPLDFYPFPDDSPRGTSTSPFSSSLLPYDTLTLLRSLQATSFCSPLNPCFPPSPYNSYSDTIYPRSSSGGSILSLFFHSNCLSGITCRDSLGIAVNWSRIPMIPLLMNLLTRRTCCTILI